MRMTARQLARAFWTWRSAAETLMEVKLDALEQATASAATNKEQATASATADSGVAEQVASLGVELDVLEQTSAMCNNEGEEQLR